MGQTSKTLETIAKQQTNQGKLNQLLIEMNRPVAERPGKTYDVRITKSSDTIKQLTEIIKRN